MKMLAIGAVFKNESHIMIEWIEHYLYHGVSDIYLINDHSTDNYEYVKNYYINNDHVVFFDSDVESGPYQRQIDIYNKYLLPIITNYTWFGIFDLDEFLYAPNYNNITDALLLVPDNINQIHINWVTFGSNYLIKQPVSAVESFTKRIIDIADPAFKSHKSIVKTTHLNALDIHTHHVSGKCENYSYIKNPSDPLLLLNHYVIQSKSFFDHVKAKRGDVNKIVGADFRNDDYFYRYDKNDVDDTQLYKQNQTLINNIRPSIQESHSTIPFC